MPPTRRAHDRVAGPSVHYGRDGRRADSRRGENHAPRSGVSRRSVAGRPLQLGAPPSAGRRAPEGGRGGCQRALLICIRAQASPLVPGRLFGKSAARFVCRSVGSLNGSIAVSLVCVLDIRDFDHAYLRLVFQNHVERRVCPSDVHPEHLLPIDGELLLVSRPASRIWVVLKFPEVVFHDPLTFLVKLGDVLSRLLPQ